MTLNHSKQVQNDELVILTLIKSKSIERACHYKIISLKQVEIDDSSIMTRKGNGKVKGKPKIHQAHTIQTFGIRPWVFPQCGI